MTIVNYFSVVFILVELVEVLFLHTYCLPECTSAINAIILLNYGKWFLDLKDTTCFHEIT